MLDQFSMKTHEEAKHLIELENKVLNVFIEVGDEICMNDIYSVMSMLTAKLLLDTNQHRDGGITHISEKYFELVRRNLTLLASDLIDEEEFLETPYERFMAMREIRTQAGYTLQQVADLMGTTKGAISKWERRHHLPSMQNALMLDNILLSMKLEIDNDKVS